MKTQLDKVKREFVTLKKRHETEKEEMYKKTAEEN